MRERVVTNVLRACIAERARGLLLFEVAAAVVAGVGHPVPSAAAVAAVAVTDGATAVPAHGKGVRVRPLEEEVRQRPLLQTELTIRVAGGFPGRVCGHA